MSHSASAFRRRFPRRPAAAVACGAVLALGLAPTASTAATAAVLKPAVESVRPPIRFEPNVGQSDPRVRFLARGAGVGLFLGADAAVVALEGPSGARAVRLRFDGSNAASVDGERALGGRSTFFTGGSAGLEAAQFGAVRYRSLYPGIDAVVYGNGGAVEYDFVLAPGGDPAAVRLGVDGADAVSVDARGDLVVVAGGFELRQRTPVAYQLVDGARRAVACAYRVDGRSVRFELGAYDRTRPLVIDPVLNYSTYLGGGGVDRVTSIAPDGAGGVIVAGSTTSADFPTQFGLAIPSRQRDAFVAKLSPAGSSLVFSTYLGGSDDDAATALAIGPNGSITVAGITRSGDFPTAGGAFTRRGTDDDVFVSRLSADGGTLVASGAFGGAGVDDVAAIAVDAAGSAYLTGATNSTDYPTQLPIQISSGGGDRDAFITKLNAAGTALAFSTYLGGSARDEGAGIAVDAAGNAVLTGFTASTNFPTRRPLQASNAGARDAFVTSINPTGTELVFSTYLGGTFNDVATAIALGPDGEIVLAGQTFSSDFPSQGTIGPNAGAGDAFVTELDGAATGVQFSTFLGGSAEDQANAVAVDAVGAAYVTGFTASTDFPTKLPLQTETGDANQDTFVAKINASGTRLGYSTYFGGNGADRGNAIAVDGSGNAYVAGVTGSTNLPTQDPIQTDRADDDGFVAKIGNAFVDLSLALQASPEPVRSEANLTYTITVQNPGPDAAGDVIVRMQTPPGTTYVSTTAPEGSACSTPDVGEVGEISCRIGTLAPGATATVTVVVKVVAEAGATVNATATVTTTATDTNTANDAASAASTVLAPVDPPVITAVSKLSDPFRVRIDGSNFQPGVRVFIGDDQTPWPSIKVKGTTRITLKGSGLKARFPKGTPVSMRVVNPDGGEATTTLTR